MSQLKLCLLALVALLLISLSTSVDAADTMFVGGKEYPLDPNIPAIYQYIGKTDPYFEWHELTDIQPKNNTEKGLVSYRVEFTSQAWLTPDATDRHIWRHNLTVIVPWAANLDIHGVSALYVTGCSVDNGKCPDEQASLVEDIAIKSKTVLSVLTQIPQQSMIFANDPTQRSRSEDAIVAYTWAEFIKNPTRPDIIAYFPMAKAAVMATTVLTQWSAKHPEIFRQPLERFYIAGASKRGATTWFSAAFFGQYMPEKLVGAAPIVFDTLNFTKSVPAMYQQLGGWTFAFKDYKNEGIIDLLNDQKALELLSRHVDPLYPWYKNGLDNVHKLVVSAVGDEFFLVLNDHYYWNSLTNKMRLMIPDAEHSLATGLTYLQNGTSGHLRQLALKKPLPEWSSSLSYPTKMISLLLWSKPTHVSVFKAQTAPSNPPRMDFRLIKRNIEGGCLPPSFVIDENICGNPVWWHATELEGRKVNQNSWIYSYTAIQDEIPTDGTFFGYYLMAAWENDPIYGNQVYTTQVMVLPEKFPFDACQPHCPPDLV